MHIAWETKTKTPASGKMLDHDLVPTHRPTRLRSRTSPTHRPAQTSHTHDHTISTPTRLRSHTSNIAWGTKTPASGKMFDHDLAPTNCPTRL